MGQGRPFDAHYKHKQLCRRTLDNLSSIKNLVEDLPEGEFKAMLLKLLDEYEPQANPFQERLPLDK